MNSTSTSPTARRPFPVRLLLLAASVIALLSASSVLLPTRIASAEPCPDVEVSFARGTTEAPGVGWLGQAFIDALQSRLGSKSVGVYAVNYPATTDFPTAADGVVDASTHIRDMAARCPSTKLVLGGYSQGAAVMGYVTAAEIPPGYIPPSAITGPMAPTIADHVAAVALFGLPSSRFLNAIDAPPINIGPLYQPKLVNECIDGDPICNNDGGDLGAHGQYQANGMVDQAADAVAAKLGRKAPAQDS